jgi:hypothetical protein
MENIFEAILIYRTKIQLSLQKLDLFALLFWKNKYLRKKFSSFLLKAYELMPHYIYF